MLKIASIAVVFLYSMLAYANPVSTDSKTFECATWEGKALTFSYSLARRVVTISKNSSISGQLMKDAPYGFVEQSDYHFTFIYHWYFTGKGSFHFSDRPVWEYDSGDQALVVISYDDGDGSGLEPTPFHCRVL